MSNARAKFGGEGSRKSRKQGGAKIKFFFSQTVTGPDEAVFQWNVWKVSRFSYSAWTVMYAFPDTLSGQSAPRQA